MANQTGLTPDQLKDAKELDKEIRKLTKLKEDLAFFKLNDIYVMEYVDQLDKNAVSVNKSHLGFPVKYKVVYISSEGIPYLRRLTPNGKPTGDVELPPEAAVLNNFVRLGKASAFHSGNFNYYRFVPDPEQLDSILLQQEFDPTADQREKMKVFNEINKHNKKIAVKTGWGDQQHVYKFFKSLNPGDKFWMSPDKVFVVQSITKVSNEWQIKALDINQVVQTFNVSYFMHKRLYRDQPRSFAKEAKP